MESASEKINSAEAKISTAVESLKKIKNEKWWYLIGGMLVVLWWLVLQIELIIN
ncbi:MAG: hypothetical protein U0T81_08870 [Saprospiraceae bacterium]